MIAEEHVNLLGPELARALEGRGFEELTAVQIAVLDPSLSDCDLRITSRTGSGKTVAIGLVLKSAIAALLEADSKQKGPCAVVVVPTRELAKQVRDELSWLYAAFGIRLACVTGGSNYRDELRALRSNPAVVVGTPGRLVDHLQRGAFDASRVSTIVLDEADRMLDLGFAEELEAIFAAATNRSHTHLVSATLAPEVLRLADRFQKQPKHVQGSRLGQAHTDIEHIVHVVPARHRLDALVNVLLSEPDERTLVFVRTRADVTNVASELTDAGFCVVTLSGDMEQQARERALLAFRQDKVRVLVATDVAARGIDIQGMTRVIHFEPPTDPDSYTHRSGRTGRAGQKGSSIVFVTPEGQQRLRALLNHARVTARMTPLPTIGTLRKAADARLLASLVDSMSTFEVDARQKRLAEELLNERDAAAVVAMLITRTKTQEPEPRFLPEHVPSAPKAHDRRARGRDSVPPPRSERRSDPRGFERKSDPRGFERKPDPRGFEPRGFERKSDPRAVGRAPHASDSAPGGSEGWGMFHVTWGQLQGADPRRLLAVLCRRGDIRGADVGAIRIGPTSSVVEVRTDVAASFAAKASQPDPEEPRIRITEYSDRGPSRGARAPRFARNRA